ncbi:MAG: DUF1214 domain-containing protein [Deltaproteobacteria bacterium]|nr:DUF1214 domain-containing protein [Deltaproteobacteria bacterium]MBW2398224.1 DUF1214 domain-containing protein [Deltaproteobacteria bacterium]
MSDEAVAKVVNAEAWNEFCDLLKKAGEVILREDLETSPFDRAEGLRYLSRLLRAGLISFAENTGPEHPYFRAMPDLVKMGLDNPDNYYLSAGINPRFDYRVRGKRGSIHYMSFAAQNQNFAARDKITGGAGHLNDAEIEIAPDGSFEIVASQKEQPGNWLQMTPDTKQILLRQTFLHREHETPVEVEIECLQSEGPPPPLDPSRVQAGLMGSAMYAIGCAQWFADWVMAFRDKAPVNSFHLPDLENHRVVGGDPNIRIWLGLWKLGPDEALVIEVTPPECDYWNFQLGNIWAESLDYRSRRVHLNSGSAKLRNDGSVRLVVAHENPGDPNWMDTAGHDHGTMCVRWVRASSHPEPKCRVVKLSDLGD